MRTDFEHTRGNPDVSTDFDGLDDVTSSSGSSDSVDAQPHVQYAQAVIPGLGVSDAQAAPVQALGEPIGTVDNVTGSISVVRADGSTDTLEIGDKVFQGDRIETPDEGGVGITLADTSTFSLGPDSEMVLDELVYDPGHQEGSAVLSLLSGTTSYVSGQIAKINPDAVNISTPVATIGIRGTKVFVEYQNGQFRAVNLLETTLEGETPGEIVFYSPNGTPLATTNEANVGWSWDGSDRNNVSSLRLSPVEVDKITEGVLKHLPPSLAEQAVEARELEQALKDAADIAAQEAVQAKEDAANAEAETANLEAQADSAQAEAEALMEQAQDAEAQLEVLQAQLAQLLANGGDPGEISQLQLQLGQLQGTYQNLLSSYQDAQLAAKQAEIEAMSAYQHMLRLQDDAYRAEAQAESAQNAAREAYEVSQNSFQKALQYVGYEANSGAGEEGNGTSNQFASGDGPTGSTQNGTDDPVFVPHGGTNEGDDGDTQQPVDEYSIHVSDGQDTTGDGESTGDPVGYVPPDDDNTPIDGDTGSGNSTSETTTINGTAIDGYLKDATVFIDVNKNGKLDFGVDVDASVDLNNNGQIDDNEYALSSHVAKTDGTSGSLGTFNLSTTLAAGDYIISMVGGTDVATGKPFYGVLQAPAGASVLTPVTTLLAKGLTESQIKTAFGIDASINLTEVDPVAGASDANVAKLAAIGVQLQNTILQASKLIDGVTSTGLTEDQTSGAVFDAIVSGIKNAGDSTYQISNSTNLESIISTAAGNVLSGAELITVQAAALKTALVISASNGKIDGYIGGSGTDFLSNLAQVAVVANDAATELENSGGNTTTLGNLVTSYSSDSLNSKIAQATIEDVTGDGNKAPTAGNTVSLSTNEDTVLNITQQDLLANARDPEEQALSVTSLSASSGTLVAKEDGSWDLTPVENSTDQVTLTYTISDGSKVTTTTAGVTVAAVNDAPEDTGDAAVAVSSSGSIVTAADLLANITDVDNSSDQLSVTRIDSVTGGSVSETDGGGWQVTPDEGSETVEITYTVSDGDLTSTATQTVVVNEPPVQTRNPQALPGTEDEPVTITTAQLLNGFSDPDGDSFSVVNLSASSGTLTDNEDGTWTLTPVGDSTQTVTLSYGVTDGYGTTQASLPVTFDPVNDAPVIGNVELANGTEDQTYRLSAQDLLASVTDVDSEGLTITSVTSDSEFVTINPVENDLGQAFYWNVTSSEEGAQNITFTVSDGNGGTASKTTSITFMDVDATPSDDSKTIAEDSAATTLSVLCNDDILDGAVISAVTQPSHGTASFNAESGQVTYTPDANFAGTDTFTYTLTDEDGETSFATVIMNVSAVNDAPTVGDQVVLNGGVEDQVLAITAAQLLANVTDIEGDTLSIVGNPTVSSGSLAVSETGWNFTPDTNSTDDVTFTFTVSDGTDTVVATAGAIASFAEDGTTEGTSGVDTLVGTEGADTITAFAGADTITGGLGDDYIDGGDDEDTLVLSGYRNGYEFGENDNGQMTISDINVEDGNDGTDVLVGVEKFQYLDGIYSAGQSVDENSNLNEISGAGRIWGSFGDDLITGSEGADRIYGLNGNDTITGGAGSDSIYGFSGDDVIILSEGDARIHGGHGTDTLRLSNGDDLNLTTSDLDVFSIEVFDMETDTSANNLTVNANNLLWTSWDEHHRGWHHYENGEVVINGGENDSLSFADDGWSVDENQTREGYTTYSHSGDDTTVYVDADITVNGG